MARKLGLFINGVYVHENSNPGHYKPVSAVADPSKVLTELAIFKEGSDAELLEATLDGATLSFEQNQQRPFFTLADRIEFLKRLKSALFKGSENMARILSQEVGKPISLARAEVERAQKTLQVTIDLGLEMQTAVQPAFGKPYREARGPLLAIAPFNFPLNLVMHKLAPAWLAGCPVILKPSAKSALTALCLADLCLAERLPAGFLSVFLCDDSSTLRLLKDERIKHVSFTGSGAVGWKLRGQCEKPIFLELGSCSPAYVDKSADIPQAAKALLASSFGFAGQSCISTQSIFVHPEMYDAFTSELKKQSASYAWGNPNEESVQCGPVIDGIAAKRISDLLKKLAADGAQTLLEISEFHGARNLQAPYIAPTVLTGLKPDHTFFKEEVFAPLVHVSKDLSFEDWIGFANKIPSRLHAAIFTNDQNKKASALKNLDFTGVVINGGTSQREDSYPYGGRGSAGTGYEGPLYAYEDYTSYKYAIEDRP